MEVRRESPGRERDGTKMGMKQESGFLRVLGFEEMWGRRGSRGERE